MVSVFLSKTALFAYEVAPSDAKQVWNGNLELR